MAGHFELARKVELLATLSDGELRSFLGMTPGLEVPAGEVLCRQGEQDDLMYILLSGAVRVRVVGDKGDDRTLTTFSPGAFFNELRPFVPTKA